MKVFIDLVEDTRYAIRGLRRSFALSVFVIITLALGIGMSAATFSMADALIFRPYPVRDASSLVTLVSTSRDRSFDNFSYGEYIDIRTTAKSYNDVIASGPIQAVGFSGRPEATPRVKGGMLVSDNYFRVLGVEPTLGRGFHADADSATGQDAVVVLDHDFWAQEFARDPSVIGRTVYLNGTQAIVIGIAPESFPGMQMWARPHFYLPLAMTRLFSTDPQRNTLDDRGAREWTIMARLKSGATLSQARSEIVLLAQNLEREYPAFNRGRGAAVRTQFEMRTRDDTNAWKFMLLFAGVGLAVLLVACTNVAGLLLSHAQTRTREIAVRLAIGAGRSRLIRMLLTQSVILACLGGLGGIAVAYGGITFLHTVSVPSELPATFPFRLDTRVLLASLTFALTSAFLCGVGPALQTTRGDLVVGLKSGDVGGPGQSRLWGRNALVIAQVSVSLMLLTASFLMMRGYHNSIGTVVGHATDHLLLARFDPRLVQYDAAQTTRFYQLLTERVRATPGVESAGLTLNPPLGLGGFGRVAFVPDGIEMPRDRENYTVIADTVDEGFFATMGIAILRGRGFSSSDTADAPRVVIVNEQFAKHYWPNDEAVGKRLRLNNAAGPALEVVGVARTVKYRQVTERPTDFVYLPLAQHPTARMLLLLRSSGDPRQLIDPLNAMVRAIDANLPISEMRTYEDVYRYNTVEGPAMGIKLIGTMGVVAVVLAIAGLYGLVSYTVSRRTREIGIRMAVGAEPRSVLRLVMGKGLVLVGAGTAIGIALGLVIEQLFNGFLFNTGGVDILAYVVVVPTLMFVTITAAYVPARRAARIAPTRALRHD